MSAGMARASRKTRAWTGPCVRVSFASSADFEREYRSALSCGGLFVATEDHFELREVVDVWLDLAFCKQAVVLQGEVVSCVPAGLEQFGGSGGVAVQLLEPADQLRKRLQRYLESDVAEPTGDPQGRRKHERKPARAEVEIEHAGSVVFARSQNVSRSGALVAVPGEPIAAGEKVLLTFVHPTSGQRMGVAATVIHEQRDERGAFAMGVRFDCPVGREAEVGDFMEDLQANEHARQLAAIKGPLGTVELEALIQMLGAASGQGVLRLSRGYEEGEIGFAGGTLHYAHVGTVRGPKALARMLSWKEGFFDFVSSAPHAPLGSEPLPLDGAIFEAMRRLDELRRMETSALAPDIVFSLARKALESDALSDLEQEVLELAEFGSAVQTILDGVEATDAEVHKALLTLITKGVISAQTRGSVC